MGVALMAVAPALAHGERVFFLVGVRHVYRIGPDMYAHLPERQKIEQDYADQVAADRDQYNKAIAQGANPDSEAPQFNSALNDLAVQRDRQLGAIFEIADYERARHPELRIDGDGPYQVIGIHFHVHAGVEFFDNFSVFAPWPGYVAVGHPYGWSYGVIYDPFAFHHLYVGWHTHFVSIGSPAFVGLVGFRGPVTVVGFSRGPHGVAWVPRGGVSRVIGRPGAVVGRPSYSHSFGGSRPEVRGSFGVGRPASHGSMGARKPASHGSFGLSRSTSHGSFGSSRSTSHGNFGSSRPASHGSFGSPRSSTYSHGSGSHSSFGHSGGSRRRGF